MLKKLAFIIASSTLIGLASVAHAATPGQTPLPKDESAAESDLEEDDHSGMPDEPKSTSDHKPEEVYRPSASQGEPIFDWSKHQNEREVDHPLAEKGLIRIDKDKNYYYKIEETKQKHAASFHVGTFSPTNLSNPEGGPNSTFADNYGESTAPAVLIEYEWQLWRGALGKLGLRAGSGIFVAQGHGHFVHNYNVNDAITTPMAEFTFLSLPNSLGAVYRLHIFHKQLFVPYAEGGGIGFTFAELRDDGKAPKFGGSLAAYAAAGIAVNLTYFDYLTRVQLDREYGINACYLTVEYRHIFALSQHFDFTTDYVNGGVLMEF